MQAFTASCLRQSLSQKIVFKTINNIFSCIYFISKWGRCIKKQCFSGTKFQQTSNYVNFSQKLAISRIALLLINRIVA